MPSEKTVCEQKVLEFIRQHRLLKGGEKVVVAVSGGPDSLCLLYILYELRHTLNIELHLAHLDHRLRGRESAADACYVSRVARRLGIPFTVAAREVKAYQASHRLSLEEAAREVRYALLAEVAVKIGAAAVAVGHTADDHIETILMHIIRGSGLAGLRGLQPRSNYRASGSTVSVIRPLLVLTRAETVAYCRTHRLSPRQDATNRSLQPLRNRLRLKLLPELEKYNPRFREALERLGKLAAADYDFIRAQAERAGAEIMRREGGGIVFDRQALLALPLALQMNLLRCAIEEIAELKDIEAVHIENILAALEKPSGKTVLLPGGLKFVTEHDRYVLAADPAGLCPFPPLEKEVVLNVPGRTVITGWDIQAAVMPPSSAEDIRENDALTACFDYGTTGGKLTVRRRRPGDVFQPLGMAVPKKLGRFMIDAGIPRVWRDRIPIVTSQRQIIWVVGARIDDRVRVTEKTAEVLRLSFERCQATLS